MRNRSRSTPPGTAGRGAGGAGSGRITDAWADLLADANAPYGRDGAQLSIWKPLFVRGTVSGGEIGVTIWGIHNDRHVNVGFTSASTKSTLLDYRLPAAGNRGSSLEGYGAAARRRSTVSTASLAATSGVSGGALAPTSSNNSRTPAKSPRSTCQPLSEP